MAIEKNGYQTLRQLMSDISWGTHGCLFYKTNKEMLDILVPYFTAGLLNHEYCLWVVSRPLDAEDALTAMRQLLPAFDVYLEKGQIEVLSNDHWYVERGVFDPQRVLRGWLDKYNQASAKGYEGMRLAGDTLWLQKDLWDTFAAYEQDFDKNVDRYRIKAICIYSLDQCQSSEVINVVNSHGYTLIKQGEAWQRIENPQRRLAEEKALERAMADLEKVVGLRTAELTEANQQLVQEINERKQVEETLLKSEERVRLVARATNDAVWDWNLATDEVWWNESVSSLFGYSADAIKPDCEWWADRIHPDDKETVLSGVRAMVDSRSQSWSWEYRYRRADGSYAHVFDRAYLMFDTRGNPARMIGAMVDITDRKKVEEQRARYMAQLSALAQASLEINSLRSMDETLRIITHSAREIIGAHQCVTSLSIDQNWSQAITALSLSDKHATYRKFDAKPSGSGIYAIVCETNRPVRMTQAEMEAHPRWRGFGEYAGQHPPLRGWLAAPLIARDGRNIGLIQLSDKYEGDFTETDEAILLQFAQLASVAIENGQLFKEARTAQAQLQTLSHRLVEIQEAERHTVARELHDEIGQALTAIKLSVERSSREQAENINSGLGQALAVINELIGRVRDLSLELRPAMLDDLGLLAALTWHLDRYTRQVKISVDFQHSGLDGRRFDIAIETAAYRIVQEALTNVARHALVTQVEVDLWADENALHIRIRDCGTGFDPGSLSSRATGGLSGMHERAIMLGGQLRVESTPGTGTLLNAELPLQIKPLHAERYAETTNGQTHPLPDRQ